MTVRLYDSRSQQLRELVPLVPGRLGVYVCGPTVQSSPHIGHLRSALCFELWRSWLEYRGYAVTLVRNVTDIDDKVLANATPDEPWWALAYRIELEFSAAYSAIGIRPPTYEPRATASVLGMQELIAELIERGHAYQADDGSADVYFDVASWPRYGELTHQRPDDMVDAEAQASGKRDPRDFALWKAAKPGEPADAAWASPWGAGRPGWHIECSAMSRRYLGRAFDIHAAGIDLRFPHHENELAQSAAAGDDFASYWMHNGLVQVEGQKMSKSLGNSIFAAEVLAAARPLVVRYALAAAHYRSNIDLQAGYLEEADAAVARIEGFLGRAARRLGDGVADSVDVPEAFAAAMDDDLGVPVALAVLHERVRAGNAALDADDVDGILSAVAEVGAMVGVLGIDPRDPRWGTSEGPALSAFGSLVEQLLAERAEARAAREFAVADRIRDRLAAAGVSIEDAPDGAHWSV